MSDVVTPVTAPSVPSLPPTEVSMPKPTTADDLLAMYDEETPTPAPKGEKVSTPVPQKKEEETTETPAKEETETPEVPSFKAKHGDKEIDIPEEAVLKAEVNGKEVEFKAKDAIQAYQKQQEFNRNMDRRVNDVTRKERALTSEYKNLKTNALSVVNSAMTGDFWASIKNLAKIAAGSSNLDVVTLERAMMDQIEALKDPYTKMTPEQRDSFFAKRRADVTAEENKRLKSEVEKRDQTTSLEGEISQLQQQYGVPPQKFWETFEFIKEKLVGEGEDKAFKTEHDVRPVDVIRQHFYNSRANLVKSVADKVNLDNPEVLNELMDGAIAHPDWDEKTIEDIIERSGVAGTAPKDVVENLNRKVKRNGAQPQSQVSSAKNGKAAGYDKEDLEYLYRNGPKGYTPLRYR